MNQGGCYDKDGGHYDYCSKHINEGVSLDDCEDKVNTLDQTKIPGLTWQTSGPSGTGKGLCVVNMISNDACLDYQSELVSDGWGCVCWNYPGNGPAVERTGNQDLYNTCYVREELPSIF